MSGGRYITLFPDDEKREARVFLYKLENLRVIKFNREKEKQNLYRHQWTLTKKGKSLLKKNTYLQKLWKEGRIQDFYNLIKDLLREE